MSPGKLVRIAQVLSISASAHILVLLAFQWTLVSWLTPFIVLPLLGLAWLAFAACAVFALVVLVARAKTHRLTAGMPLLIQLGALVLAWAIPFTRIALSVDFRVHRGDREHVVEMVKSGELHPAPGDVRLPPGLSHVSENGKIVVAGGEDRPTVLFFTFLGVPDSFSGFVYSANDRPPDADLFATEWVEVVKVDDHWYFVSGT